VFLCSGCLLCSRQHHLRCVCVTMHVHVQVHLHVWQYTLLG
jgi:hypothetical protein